MPLLRIQHFAASSSIAKTNLTKVEAAFDEDIKTLKVWRPPPPESPTLFLRAIHKYLKWDFVTAIPSCCREWN